MIKINKQENNHLESIFDSTFDEIVIMDREFNILNANLAFCKTYGITPTDIAGNKCHQLIHGLKKPCSSRGLICPAMEVLKTGEQFKCMHSHRNSDNKINVELLAYPIKNEENQVKFIVKIGRTIRENNVVNVDNLNDLNMHEIILSNIDNSVFVISKDYKILFVNNHAINEFGKHLIGKLCYKTLNHKNLPCKQCVLNRRIASPKEKTKFKTDLRDLISNKFKNLEINCIPLDNYNDKQVIISIIKDLTLQNNAEKLLKDSEERYKILLDNFPYPMFLLDSEGKIYDYNSSVELYLELPQNSLINRNFFDIFKLSDEKFDEIKEILYYVDEFNLNEIKELEIKDSANNYAWIETFFSSITLNNKKLIQVIVHDITENKLVESIIREENERLRKLNEVKNQLTSQTSEELKSPLNQMFDASQILLDSYKDKLDENAKNLLELIVKGGETSLDLVGRIVDISRFESDNFNLNRQTENLGEILKNSVENVKQKSTYSKNIFELECNMDLYSDIDKERIEQVINEILSKIIRESKLKTNLFISLQENQDNAEIKIYNKIENFNNIENLRKEIEESLYGLYFSKEIIELHGGQISVELHNKLNNIIYKIKLPLKNWIDSLIQIFIICNSGIPIYGRQFTEELQKKDYALISGGFIGMISILKEIVQGENEIKTIDHGDRKMLVETNKTKDIIFALLIKGDIKVFSQKIKAFIEEFDIKFEHLISNIEDTASSTQNWKEIEILVEKYFGN